MVKEFANPDLGSKFILTSDFPTQIANEARYFMFIWNDGHNQVKVLIDDTVIHLDPGMITCTTYLHRVQVSNSDNGLKTLLFNREFYCVHTHDSEVSCNGLLFFGSNTSPVLKLDEGETRRLRTLVSVLDEEFSIMDSNREEMLRILLKRFIIRCTRLAKQQILKRNDKQSDIDLVRLFNILVEENFKKIKSVGEYAALMHKSPKTITNVFSQFSADTPLQVIHKRVIMEAKRFLLYTDKTVKEIVYELGYTDQAQFSKLFKNQTGMTTSDFRKK